MGAVPEPNAPLVEFSVWMDALDVPGLKQLGMDAVAEAQRVHDALGDAGRQPANVEPNTFGDRPLRGDLACEAAVLDVFRDSGRSFVFVTEEHGTGVVGDDPQFTLVIDGVDGSDDYARGGNDYGTMFAVFPGLQPRYRDAVFAAIVQQARRRWLVTISGEGTFQYFDGTRRGGRIFTSGQQELRRHIKEVPPGPRGTLVSVDVGIDGVRGIEGRPMWMHFAEPLRQCGIAFDDAMPCVGQVAALLMRELDLVCTGTRKGNLGLIVANELIALAGGFLVVVDSDGTVKPIGVQPVRTFAQDRCVPVLAAATLELAASAARRLHSLWASQA